MTKKIQVFQQNYRLLPVSIIEDGNAKDVTGWTISWTVKHRDDNNQNDNDALISKTVTIDNATTAPQGHIELTSLDTALPIGVYRYDYLLIDDTDNPYNSSQGLFEIVARTTTGVLIS